MVILIHIYLHWKFGSVSWVPRGTYSDSVFGLRFPLVFINFFRDMKMDYSNV